MKTTKTREEFENKIKKLESKIALITDINGIHRPIQDGIIDLERYLSSKIRIMWVLKDANSSDDSDWDQRDAIADLKTDYGIKNDWKKTFQHIIYTTYGILNNKDWDEIPNIDKDNNYLVDALKEIAYINIKKIPGGSSVADVTLKEYYEKDREILIEQLNSLEPQIIIFGNTMNYFKTDLNLVEIKTFGNIEFCIYNNKLLIHGYHPNYISRGGVNAKEHYSDIKKVSDDFINGYLKK